MRVRVKDELEKQFIIEFYAHMNADSTFLDRYMFEIDIDIEVADGCRVEHDGRCHHGYTSPLRILGMI